MAKDKTKNLDIFIKAFTISSIGTDAQMLILPLFFIDSGSPASMIGLLSFAYTLPNILVSIFSGIFADRYNRKRMLYMCDFISGSLMLILFFLSLSKGISLGWIIIFQGLLAGVLGVFTPVRKGILPQLSDKMSYDTINVKVSSGQVIAALISPFLGLIIYEFFGVLGILLLNSISFYISAVFEMQLVYHHKVRIIKKGIGAWFMEIKEAFIFIKKQEMLVALCWFFLIFFAILQPMFMVVVPIFFRSYLSYSNLAYGGYQLTFSLGAFGGIAILKSMIDKKTSRENMRIGILLALVAMAGFSILTTSRMVAFSSYRPILYFILMSLAAMVMMVALMLANVPVQGMIQRTTPEHFLSRVSAYMGLVFRLGIPFASLLIGHWVDLYSVNNVVIGCSILMIVFATVFLYKIENYDEV